MNNQYDRTFEIGDELYHWKYVKRVRQGDKWKYYYDWDELKKDTKNALGADEKEARDKAKVNVASAKVSAEEARTNIDKEQDSIVEKAKQINKLANDALRTTGKNTNLKIERELAKYWNKIDNNLENAKNTARDKKLDLGKAELALQKAEKAYNKTPMGIVENLTEPISKGVEAIKKVAKKLAAVPMNTVTITSSLTGTHELYEAYDENGKRVTYDKKDYDQVYNEKTGEYELVKKSDGTKIKAKSRKPSK